MAQYAKISSAAAMSIKLARAHASDADRKAVKSELFASAKSHFGIPLDHKFVVELDPHASNFCVLRNKATREPYLLDDASGKWVGAVSAATQQETMLWFKMDKDNLKQAIIDYLEAQKAKGEPFDGMYAGESLDDHHALNEQDVLDEDTNGAPVLVLDDEDNYWVRLAADHFEDGTGTQSAGSEEHDDEDDRPY